MENAKYAYNENNISEFSFAELSYNYNILRIINGMSGIAYSN
jgi:hypothetical protein